METQKKKSTFSKSLLSKDLQLMFIKVYSSHTHFMKYILFLSTFTRTLAYNTVGLAFITPCSSKTQGCSLCILDENTVHILLCSEVILYLCFNLILQCPFWWMTCAIFHTGKTNACREFILVHVHHRKFLTVTWVMNDPASSWAIGVKTHGNARGSRDWFLGTLWIFPEIFQDPQIPRPILPLHCNAVKPRTCHPRLHAIVRTNTCREDTGVCVQSGASGQAHRCMHRR